MSRYSSDPRDHAFEEEQSVALIGPGAPYMPRMDYCRWCGKHRSEHVQKELRKGLMALALLVKMAFSAAAQPLTGPARVIDGDSLEIQGQRIRIHGMDAPELRQTCLRPKGSGRVTWWVTWACGVSARRHLEELISGRPVTCRPLDRDRYDRIVARCFVGSPHIDLGGWLVRYGHAVAYTRYSNDYLPQQSVARGGRLGIWAGSFVPPEEWRKGKR